MNFKASIERAMGGRNLSGIVAITAMLQNDTLSVRYISNQKLSEDIKENCRCIGTEILADCKWNSSFKEEFFQVISKKDIQNYLFESYVLV